jgi:galactonate dehydratase
VPVYELLGGRVRDSVLCYAHVGGDASNRRVEELVEACLKVQAEGWKALRWHLAFEGRVLEPRLAVRRAIQEMEAVRAACGDELEICFDVHTRLDAPDSIRLCRAVEPLHPFFMEDALRSEHKEGYRHLRNLVAVSLAAGEQCATKWDFRPLVEEELIDYARVDVCICGGLSEARKIAAACETHYVKLATHNPLGPVSTAACLHLNLAVSNFGIQEQPVRPGTTLTDLFPVQVEWADGSLLPPTRPGLGVEIDRAVAARMREEFRLYEPPHLRRRDGSFTNW